MNGPVVVGVDGTSAGLDAVETAARQAERRGAELRLTHALTWPSRRVPAGVAPWDPDGAGAGGRVNQVLSDAEERARGIAPHLAISREVLFGEPETVLGSEARAACLAVVGGHRVNGTRGRLRGSVAGRRTAHADCPVLGVGGGQARTGPVVLAADEHTAADAAEFAFAEAAERGADLVVLRTRRGGGTPVGVLSGLRERYPHVAVRTAVVRGRHHRALVEACSDAQLVVVAVRRRSGRAALVPGSEGRSLLRDARCPVALVPSTGR